MRELELSGLGPVTVIEADPELIPDRDSLPGRLVVDVGCGTGTMVRWFESRGATALGLDTATMLSKARSAHPAPPGRLVGAAAERLPLRGDTADVVLLLASLHHVPAADMLTALSEAARVLKPGGTLVVVEPVAADGAYSTLTRLVEDETEVLAAARRALERCRDAGLAIDSESLFALERTLEDYRKLLQVFVEDDGERRDLLRRAEDLTRPLASAAGVAEEDFTYPSVCRRTILTKIG